MICAVAASFARATPRRGWPHRAQVSLQRAQFVGFLLVVAGNALSPSPVTINARLTN